MSDFGEFERHVAELSRGPLHYYRAGSGADVLYLHAAAGLQIRAVPKRLIENFRLWIPVVPGYEGTPVIDDVQTIPSVAALIAEFVTTVVAGPVDVVGHSMGSRIGAWLTLINPELVDQLILMAPSGFRPLDAPALSFDSEIFLKQLYTHPERRPAETRSPEAIEGNRRAMRHYNIGTSYDADLVERIGEIDKLTLLLHGTKDVRVLPESMQLLRQKMKFSQLVYVYDAAHSLEIDQPERVANLVDDFLRRGEVFIVNPGLTSDAQASAE